MNENIGNMFQADQVPGGPGSVCQQWQFPILSVCFLLKAGCQLQTGFSQSFLDEIMRFLRKLFSFHVVVKISPRYFMKAANATWLQIKLMFAPKVQSLECTKEHTMVHLKNC